MADKIIVQQKQSLWLGYVIIAIAIAGLATGAYLLYRQLMPKPTGASGTDAAGSAGTENPKAENPGIITKVVDAVKTTVQNATNSSAFPLHQGSRGPEVAKVQHYLNVRFNAGLTEDGIWGSLTNKAIFNNASTTSVSQAEYNNMIHWLNTENIAVTGVRYQTDQNI